MQTDHIENGARGSALDLGPVYYVLFRHKWKIAIALALGVLGAVAVVFILRIQYKSEAKVLIRYILDAKTVGPAAGDAQIKLPDSRGENIISSEQEILTSLASIQLAADQTGPDKILAKVGGGNNIYKATRYLAERLEVHVPPKSDVLRVSLRHPDKEIAVLALNHIITNFLTMHHQVHGVGIRTVVLNEQANAVRIDLRRLEDELKNKKSGPMVNVEKNGPMVSLEETRKELNEDIVRVRHEIGKAETELATKHAALEFVLGISGKTSDTNKVATPEQIQRADDYRDLLKDLSDLRQKQRLLSSRYQDDSPQINALLKRKQDLIAKKKTLEAEDPQLAVVTFEATAGEKLPLSRTEILSQIAILNAQTNHLHEQFANILTNLASLEMIAPEIKELERQRDWKEQNYKWFSTKQEQANYDETMGSNYSNLQVLQPASPAVLDLSSMKKPLAMVLAGGLLLGLGLALFCEFVLDQTVRHPAELRGHFNLPLLVTIPDVSARKRRLKQGSPAAPVASKGINGEGIAGVQGIDPNGVPAVLSSFFGALRDRTVMYLERMTHKPKLVAVTGCDSRSGVSTIATGLARALSETAEGRVLLVDMTSEFGASHPFLNGKPICALSEMLEPDKAAFVHENLYVATAMERAEGSLQIVPKRFASLIPKLKASDYDYVVFDMPPVTQTSITPRLASLMDIVLLVVESERSQRSLVQSATEALVEARANVRSVLNKHRTYIPPRLYQEH